MKRFTFNVRETRDYEKTVEAENENEARDMIEEEIEDMVGVGDEVILSLDIEMELIDSDDIEIFEDDEE